MADRGSYAKGVAKRDEILRTALDVIARNGYRHTSVRELADAVGLSQAGLLHYFASKEELFTEILRKRDEVDSRRLAVDSGGASIDGLIQVVQHNVLVPGLVQLYAQLSVEATDAAHPAHAYFLERNALLRTSLAAAVRDAQRAGSLPADLEAESIATIFIALSDGLQVQWLLDPSADMAKQISYLWGLIGSAASAAGSAATDRPEPAPETERPT
jgi:AcrR family transcriptional regulator